MGLKTLLTIFELVSINKLTSNIDVSPHLIDFSRGSICCKNYVEDDELVLLVDFLKSSKIITLFECKTYHIDTYNGVLLFSAGSLPSQKTDLSFISSLWCFLERFSIKMLTLKKCKFTEESITALCDLIRSNTSLTSVEFRYCNLSDSGFMNVINALQFKSCFKIIDLDNSNVKPKSLFRCLDVIFGG
ncbi:hypothetical protein GEMRC1_013461 [Eukaryota sp. GEM-RC1]